MNKLYVGLGILLIIFGLFVAYFTGVGLERNFTALKIISNISSFLMIVSFMAVGGLLIITGVKKS